MQGRKRSGKWMTCWYTVRVKTWDGLRTGTTGSLSDCLAFVHDLGIRVKWAKIRGKRK